MQRGIQSKLIKAKSIPLNYRKSNQEREREREREREKERAYLQFALRREDWIETKRRKPNKRTTMKERERERVESILLVCVCVCVCVWCCYILERRQWTNTLIHRCFSSSPFFMKSINLSFFFFFFLRNPWTYFPIDIHHCHV